MYFTETTLPCQRAPAEEVSGPLDHNRVTYQGQFVPHPTVAPWGWRWHQLHASVQCEPIGDSQDEVSWCCCHSRLSGGHKVGYPGKAVPGP